MKNIKSIIYNTTQTWLEHNPFTKSASIAYYFIFSLPALLYIIIQISKLVLQEDVMSDILYGYIGSNLGSDAASTVQNIISSTHIESSTSLYLIFGIVVTIISATTIITQLQDNLDEIWGYKDSTNNVKTIIKERLISFLWIISLGFIMISFFIASTILELSTEYVTSYVDISPILISILNNIFTFTVVTFIISSLFKILPKEKYSWNITWIGAFITAALFMVGKYLIGLYFSLVSPTSVFGASSSILLILIWINYMCLIFFWGAEFTAEIKKSEY